MGLFGSEDAGDLQWKGSLVTVGPVRNLRGLWKNFTDVTKLHDHAANLGWGQILGLHEDVCRWLHCGCNSEFEILRVA